TNSSKYMFRERMTGNATLPRGIGGRNVGSQNVNLEIGFNYPIGFLSKKKPLIISRAFFYI
ncbi:MAG TPA: hypothetical protein VK833_04555, partial [Gillisia sp.]|nr:hypothetical protein [Gillisia sp.]